MDKIKGNACVCLAAVLGLGVMAVACSSDPIDRGDGSGTTGTLNAKLQSDSPHDVSQVAYRVVAVGDDCSGPAIAEKLSPLEEENLPASLEEGGPDAGHRFSDALFTLAPGDYRLCATPLAASGYPSEDCAPTDEVVSVSPGMTTEVVLVSQCGGDQNGGLDGVLVLNDPPQIDDVTIEPSKFIETCEAATLTATVSDPDGDEIASISWQLLTPGPTLVGTGNTATFTATTAGDYEVEIQATDVYGGVGSLVVPIHVTGEDCGCGGTRPNVLLCGTSQRDVHQFVPAGLNLVEGCTPDASTQAMLITRSGGSYPVLFDAATLESYVQDGGIVITEWSTSANVFNAVFPETVTLGGWAGSCSDNVNPAVRFNTTDPFWVANGGLPPAALGDTGCGYDMSAYPGITPLGGWSEGTVELAYRDLGAGRVWLLEADWQDTDRPDDPIADQLMQYMVQNGGGDACDVPAVCTGGNDPATGSPWVVCAADDDTAWVSADNAGYFHVDRICQDLGYAHMSQYGGTCGNVCGYCEQPTSCESTGNRYFDGAGYCGSDELGLQICYTVMWECVR